MSLPPALAAYRAVSDALSPFAGALLNMRVQSGKEDASRLEERFGRTNAQRPEGLLVWLHGASVGEARVLEQVRAGLAERHPNLSFLITTGTRTSAELVGAKLPPRTLHQFAPIDSISPVRRFLDHWRPDLAVFAESELWPNLILETARTGARMALVNARMTPKSLENWRRTPESAAWLLACFDVILPADTVTAEGIAQLTGEETPLIGNLKLAASAPSADPQLLADLRGAVGQRKVWLAASTHPGEDEMVLDAHKAVRGYYLQPDTLLIIAPRHPERGEAIAKLAGDAPRRANAELPTDHPVYVLDTMGELGTAFALAPVTLVCGSLLPTLKGHNPVEPVKAGSVAISGMYVQSFADIYAPLRNGVEEVYGAGEIAASVSNLLNDPERRAEMLEAAQSALGDANVALTRTIDELSALLEEAPAYAPA